MMTKKEQAMVAELRQALALHRTGPVERNVPRPAPFAKPEMVAGWDYNIYTLKTRYVWLHFNGSYGIESDEVVPQPERNVGGWSHDHHPLFSTRELALRAMRYAIEQEAAKKLADIDARIEAKP